MARVENDRASESWDRLRIYRERYPIDHLLEQVDSLNRSINRREDRRHALRRRLIHLEKELSAVRSDLAAVTREVAGSRAAGALLIDTVLDRVRQDNDERWSPTPLRGFRVWQVESGSIWGNQVAWPEPRLESHCLRSVPGEDIPHSIRVCGPPACGIYAVKDLSYFPRGVASCEMREMAVGVVALTGKVVEHELGYRAQRVSVTSLAVHHGERRVVTDRAAEIETLFRSPAGAIERLADNGLSSPKEAREFLEKSQKEGTWKSEKSCG